METASYILMAVGGLAALAGFIIVLMVAFRVSVGWGLAVLFLSWLVIPLVVFLVKYWSEARAGFLLSVSGWVVSGVGSFLLAGAVATAPAVELARYEPPQRLQPEPPRGTENTDDASTWDEGSADNPVVTPTPTAPAAPATATPAAEERGDAVHATPLPATIPFDEAGDHVGEWVVLLLSDGSSSVVVIEGVQADALRVTKQVGGGTMTYPIKWDLIAQIRPIQ